MIRVGVNYEGRDPRFVETVLPFAGVVEVTPDAIATLRDGVPVIPAETIEELKAIGERATIALHGVGLSIASAGGMTEEYLALVDTLMSSLDVAWHSEHLGYVTVDGEHLGTMLVPPRTEEVLLLVCDRVREIQARYGKPFLLEHVVNLFPDPGGGYTAAGFLNEIVRRTGCGLILDVYNLECDAHNGIVEAKAFLDELDLDAVREIHVACGTEDRGLQVDVHSRVTRECTLDLLRSVLVLTPNVEAVIFEILGPAVPSVGIEAIAAELRRVREVVDGIGVIPSRRSPQGRSAVEGSGSSLQHGIPRRSSAAPQLRRLGMTLAEQQRAMRDLIRGTGIADDPYIVAASESVGLQVTRDTIRGWQRFRLSRNCRLTTALLRTRGTYEEILGSTECNSPYIEELSSAFLRAACAYGDPLLASVASFERALLRADDAEETIAWPCDPYTILGALLQGAEILEVAEQPHQTIVSKRIPGLFRVSAA
ncbi:MAG TPA: DUF692 family protein [Thermoanaerobaculia bacterium]